jgi:alkanesulfonate monooxygenase SsuD/methylene tetrahydromethanopterin reductase-like flavin-dependent oxidoreductase (luciferase family)
MATAITAARLEEIIMDFGLGLPISDPAALPDWARRAEAAGFDTLALLDRLVYDNPEPLTALAVLAGATSRVRLQTEVLLGPLRQTALLAKQAATLDRMSGGRFVLGIGVGSRADDFTAAGTAFAERGRILDRQLTLLREIWSDGSPVGPGPATPAGPPGLSAGSATAGGLPGSSIGPRPATPGGPLVLIGAFAPAAVSRVASHADGFICAAPPERAEPLISSVREQWTAAGRPGRPRIVGQVNVAVGGPAIAAQARAAIGAYYAFIGRPGFGEPLTDPSQIADAVAAYRELGADELVLYCYAEDPGQVERVAALVH